MYDQEYINYLLHFHCDRDYFECHEILEEHWKKEPVGQRKIYWVGLIQIAVSLYHHRRGNFSGALKMMKNALHILERERHSVSKLGLHSDELIKALKKRQDEISINKPYYSLNLPINDHVLLQICKNKAVRQQYEWGKISELSNEYITHKHILRDRSEVINERLKQLSLRVNTRK